MRALRAEKPRCQADPSGVVARPFSIAASKAPELLPVAESVSHQAPSLITPLVKPDRLFPISLAGNRGGNPQGSQPVPDRNAVLRLIPQEFPEFVQGYAVQQRGPPFRRGAVSGPDQELDQLTLASGQSQQFGSQPAPALADSLGWSALLRMGG